MNPHLRFEMWGTRWCVCDVARFEICVRRNLDLPFGRVESTHDAKSRVMHGAPDVGADSEVWATCHPMSALILRYETARPMVVPDPSQVLLLEEQAGEGVPECAVA
jgi:hypothetical protein